MRLLVLLSLIAAPLSAQQPDSVRKVPTERVTTTKVVDTTVTERVITSKVVDTAIVSYFTRWTDSVKPPPDTTPRPPVGKVYFKADAESGSLVPWSSWGTVSHAGGIRPVISTARAKTGRGSIKYEVPANAPANNYSQTQASTASPSMGAKGGGFLSGWWSTWVYVESGYDEPGWNMLAGWQTGVSYPNGPSPISHMGLEVWGGTLQVVYVLKNCSVGLYKCPEIPGYKNNGGWYTMTPQSPRGIVEFPRNRWVHLSMYYGMAKVNGKVEIWQDGQKIMDLTAPTMNTFGGHSRIGTSAPLTNADNDLNMQVGIYGSPKKAAQRIYLDDFQVTSERVAP